jgi:hypothetical protein
MYTDKRVKLEIERLKTGKKTKIYIIIATVLALIFLKYIDDGFDSDILFLLAVGFLVVSEEVEKLKIVKMMGIKDKL